MIKVHSNNKLKVAQITKILNWILSSQHNNLNQQLIIQLNKHKTDNNKFNNNNNLKSQLFVVFTKESYWLLVKDQMEMGLVGMEQWAKMDLQVFKVWAWTKVLKLVRQEGLEIKILIVIIIQIVFFISPIIIMSSMMIHIRKKKMFFEKYFSKNAQKKRKKEFLMEAQQYILLDSFSQVIK